MQEIDHLIPPAARPQLGQGDVLGGAVHDGVQELVLVPEVAVHAHGPDVELLREPAHAERLEAILLDNRERGVDDPLPRQPAGPRFCSARHLCTV